MKREEECESMPLSIYTVIHNTSENELRSTSKPALTAVIERDLVDWLEFTKLLAPHYLVVNDIIDANVEIQYNTIQYNTIRT